MFDLNYLHHLGQHAASIGLPCVPGLDTEWLGVVELERPSVRHITAKAWRRGWEHYHRLNPTRPETKSTRP